MSADDDAARKRDFRQEVTDSIIQLLERGVAPWQKPWSPGAIEMPFNPVTDHPYRGGNAINLMAAAINKGYEDPRWITFKQARVQGWYVRAGEKGSQIEFWQFRDRQTKSPVAEEPREMDETSISERPVHRTYTVFNAKQIEGIPAHEPKHRQDWEIVESAERILENSAARISHDQDNRAFYNPGSDTIHLPSKAAFPTAAGYYGTALHELGHWTGHPSRLNRPTMNDSYRFGDTNYAKEELRAELTSLFLAAERGIPHDPESHAAYVDSWIKVLRDDKHEIFRAAREASLSTDYLLGLERVQVRGPDAGDIAGMTRGDVLTEIYAGVLKEARQNEEVLVKTDSALKAEAIAKETMGSRVRIYPAQTSSGIYSGTIIAETDHHVIQKLNDRSAVIHPKERFSPAGTPAIGQTVQLKYSPQGVAVNSITQPKAKAKERGR